MRPNQASPLVQAIRRRDVVAMIEAARAERPVDLETALAMLVVLADAGDGRFERWSAHWVRRLADERRLGADALTQVRTLVAMLPNQGEARGVEVALRSYAAPPRTWG